MACAAWAPADAQELARSVRLSADNDYFDFWMPPRVRPDDNYTQGVRFAWDLARVPRFVRGLVCTGAAACGTTLEIGQEIYTPTVDWSWPLPGERPYAGWLYGRGEARGADSRGMRSVALTVGVTGPPSLGSAVQNTFHSLIPEFREPLGWAFQLPTEVAFGVRGAQSWRLSPPGAAGQFVDVVPTMSASFGSLRTAAGVGARASVGLPLAHPWFASSVSNVAPYFFAGLRGDLIVRDLFLDGTLFRESARVTHKTIFGECELGVGIRVRRLRLEYRAVTRSREYVTGPASHAHGSLTVSWVLR